VRAAIFLALALCGVQTVVASPPPPITSPGEMSMNAVQNYIWPVLKSAGKKGRIYYEAICPPAKDHRPAFPPLEVRPPVTGATTPAAVRSIFRNEKGVSVAEDPPGIIRVRIGRVPDAILRTPISTLSLDPIEQYNPLAAIGAIENAPEVRSAMAKLHLAVSARVINMPVEWPTEGPHHLPPELSNVTMDQALDMVARTWDYIVFYGACTEPGIYEIF
jgi:hypothetical protein